MPYIFRCENCEHEEDITAQDVGHLDRTCEDCGVDGCDYCTDGTRCTDCHDEHASEEDNDE